MTKFRIMNYRTKEKIKTFAVYRVGNS